MWTLLCKFIKGSLVLLRNRLGTLPQIMTATVAAFEGVPHVLGLFVFNQLKKQCLWCDGCGKPLLKIVLLISCQKSFRSLQNCVYGSVCTF